jgi:hypothetical protein
MIDPLAIAGAHDALRLMNDRLDEPRHADAQTPRRRAERVTRLRFRSASALRTPADGLEPAPAA